MTSAADRRLAGFLAISLALHVLWLAIPLPTRGLPPTLAPLSAHLAPPASPQKSAVVARQAAVAAAPATASASALIGQNAPAPETAAPRIDIDAAFATARSQGREAQARTMRDAPPPTLTVEAAVARATQGDTLIETRGAAGEYVTMMGKTRCVTPLVVPHFLEGKTMLTQCESRKS